MRLEAQTGIEDNGRGSLCHHVEYNIPAASRQQISDQRRRHSASIATPTSIGVREDIAKDSKTMSNSYDMRPANRCNPVAITNTVEYPIL